MDVLHNRRISCLSLILQDGCHLPEYETYTPDSNKLRDTVAPVDLPSDLDGWNSVAWLSWAKMGMPMSVENYLIFVGKATF